MKLKAPAVILPLVAKKAFNNIKWHYLFPALGRIGFHPYFLHQIKMATSLKLTFENLVT